MPAAWKWAPLLPHYILSLQNHSVKRNSQYNHELYYSLAVRPSRRKLLKILGTNLNK